MFISMCVCVFSVCFSGETVALKEVKMSQEVSREGFPLAALREIGSLLELKHPNIIPVREMVVGDTTDEVRMYRASY